MKNSKSRKTKTLSKSDLRQLIQDSVKSDFLKASPINPFAIAQSEGIVLVGHQSLHGFDGCLHYRSERGAFALHYVDNGEQHPRTRYTLGHELGHYFIPEHHQLLLAGKKHGSKVEALRVDEREAEANSFAAHLLCPSEALQEMLRDVSAPEIIRVANHFQISYSAAARRIIEETDKACALVFSKDGIIAYALRSDELRAFDFPSIQGDKPLPRNATKASPAPSNEKLMYVSDWFPTAPRRILDRELWEETLSLGQWGQITILVYEAADGEEDE